MMLLLRNLFSSGVDFSKIRLVWQFSLNASVLASFLVSTLLSKPSFALQKAHSLRKLARARTGVGARIRQVTLSQQKLPN